jgi:hypothetical protein
VASELKNQRFYFSQYSIGESLELQRSSVSGISGKRGKKKPNGEASTCPSISHLPRVHYRTDETFLNQRLPEKGQSPQASDCSQLQSIEKV